MINFKKILLSMLVLATTNILSVNCFAMKKNSENIFTNNKKDNNSKNNKSPYSDFDEFSMDSITPTLNNVNYKQSNNKNNKYLNKKTKLENEDEKKEENISKISNDNKDKYNSEKNPINKINNNIININEDNELNVFNEIKDNKNLLTKENNISKISNDNKDKYNSEEDSSSKIDENDIIEIDENNELSVSDEIKNEKRLLKEEYKNFFITNIFKDKMALEVDNVIEEYIKNYNSKNNKLVYLENSRCGVTFNLDPLKLGDEYKKLKSTAFTIWLPRDTKRKFKGEDFEDLINNIISNYKVIIGKAYEKTMDFLKNLDKNTFINIISDRKFKLRCENIDNYLRFCMLRPEKFKTRIMDRILEGLQNINENKKDVCFKFFSNIKTFMHSIVIKAAESNTQVFKVVRRTNISGKDLAKNETIQRNGKEIKFKDNKFFQNLIND